MIISELRVAGMDGNAALREFVRNVLRRGHAETDLERIMGVLTENHVKVGSVSLALAWVAFCRFVQDYKAVDERCFA